VGFVTEGPTKSAALVPSVIIPFGWTRLDFSSCYCLSFCQEQVGLGLARLDLLLEAWGQGFRAVCMQSPIHPRFDHSDAKLSGLADFRTYAGEQSQVLP